MTPDGFEPANFRFVAQHINHCATAVPDYKMYTPINVICTDKITNSLAKTRFGQSNTVTVF